MIYTLLLLQELIGNVTPTPLPPNPNAVTIKDIISILGVSLGAASGLIIFFLTRKNKVKDDRTQEQKDQDNQNRQDRNDIIKNCKEERDLSKKEYSELNNKYDELYEVFMGTKIELAVIQFEHELLYSKLTPEDAQNIKRRVGVFKDSLTDLAIKGKEERATKKEEGN